MGVLSRVVDAARTQLWSVAFFPLHASLATQEGEGPDPRQIVASRGHFILDDTFGPFEIFGPRCVLGPVWCRGKTMHHIAFFFKTGFAGIGERMQSLACFVARAMFDNPVCWWYDVGMMNQR